MFLQAADCNELTQAYGTQAEFCVYQIKKAMIIGNR